MNDKVHATVIVDRFDFGAYPICLHFSEGQSIMLFWSCSLSYTLAPSCIYPILAARWNNHGTARLNLFPFIAGINYQVSPPTVVAGPRLYLGVTRNCVNISACAYAVVV